MLSTSVFNFVSRKNSSAPLLRETNALQQPARPLASQKHAKRRPIRMSSIGPDQPVAVVTGASGFIASELVAQLLAKGYTVRGTVRDPANRTKVAHLEALGAALPGRLTLHAADLLKPGSFDEAIQGATFVFHVASPIVMYPEDPVKEVIEPAVQGTKTVLEAAVRSKSTVRRVVFTSSISATMKVKSGPSNKELGMFTHEDINTDATLETLTSGSYESTGAYAYAKTEAERLAWTVANANGLSLVAVCPAVVMGPVLSSRTDSPVVAAVAAYLEGRAEEPTFLKSTVDVRDLGRSFIRAAEVPSASGRYIASFPQAVHSAQLSHALSAAFPGFKFPPGKAGEATKPEFDVSRTTTELGMHWTSPSEMIEDMARTLFATGVAKPVLKTEE